MSDKAIGLRASDASAHRVRRAVLALACLALAACVFGLSGCRISDALTEVVYDQTSDIIDYDNPTKIYVNDSTADQESDQFSAKEVSDDTDVVSSTVQNLVVFSSNPNTQGFTTKKSVWSKTPDFRGLEASETVAFVKSDDADAFDHPLTIEEPEEEPQQEPEVVQQTTPDPNAEPVSSGAASPTEKTADTDKSGGTGETGDDGWEDIPADAGTGSASGSGDSGSAPDPGETEEGGGNGNGEVPVAYDAADPTADPPKADKIAAFGPAATIVQMIGGKGALAATDSDTAASKFADVFADSMGEIAVGWSGDGADASDMNVDAIVSSGAKTILVYMGDYLDGLSDADRQALSKAGITLTVIYPLNSSGNIKRDVEVVGQVLSESKNIQHAGNTERRASDYASFHDRVVKAAADAHGGLAGDTVYQTGGDDDVPGFSSESPKYTLLVDAFDASASYTGSEISGWKPSDGLAFASGGYSDTPVSYYIQAGGLVNTIAERTNSTASGEYVVWQFTANSFKFKRRDWNGGSVTDDASTIASDSLSLVTTPYDEHAMFAYGQSLGTDAFPRLVAKSSSIRQELLTNSADPNGLYHPYGFLDFDAGSAYSSFGPVSAVIACLGVNGASSGNENIYASGSIDEDDVVVNPTGLFSDWTAGTVESFLESAWANDVVLDGGSKVDWQGCVNDFYSEFYGYGLSSSDWNYMLEGM